MARCYRTSFSPSITTICLPRQQWVTYAPWDIRACFALCLMAAKSSEAIRMLNVVSFFTFFTATGGPTAAFSFPGLRGKGAHRGFCGADSAGRVEVRGPRMDGTIGTAKLDQPLPIAAADDGDNPRFPKCRNVLQDQSPALKRPGWPAWSSAAARMPLEPFKAILR